MDNVDLFLKQLTYLPFKDVINNDGYTPLDYAKYRRH